VVRNSLTIVDFVNNCQSTFCAYNQPYYIALIALQWVLFLTHGMVLLRVAVVFWNTRNVMELGLIKPIVVEGVWPPEKRKKRLMEEGLGKKPEEPKAAPQSVGQRLLKGASARENKRK
jgi:hypothetical protein